MYFSWPLLHVRGPQRVPASAVSYHQPFQLAAQLPQPIQLITQLRYQLHSTVTTTVTSTVTSTSTSTVSDRLFLSPLTIRRVQGALREPGASTLMFARCCIRCCCLTSTYPCWLLIIVVISCLSRHARAIKYGERVIRPSDCRITWMEAKPPSKRIGKRLYPLWRRSSGIMDTD